MPALMQKLKNGFINRDIVICKKESAETIKIGIKSIWQAKADPGTTSSGNA